jgi:hypothetical protein
MGAAGFDQRRSVWKAPTHGRKARDRGPQRRRRSCRTRADAAGLVAAYDRYVSGQGFEIRLVNVSTGAAVTVPAGVNTADDELHPALSANGRFLVFTRMKLQPKLNGDIVPPALRTLQWVDRQTGQITQLNAGIPPFTCKEKGRVRLTVKVGRGNVGGAHSGPRFRARKRPPRGTAAWWDA